MSELLQLTIENARTNQAALLKILDEPGRVALDLTAIESVDLSGLQLLVAFIREADVRKKDIHITGVSDVLRGALIHSGMAPDISRPDEPVESVIKAVC